MRMAWLAWSILLSVTAPAQDLSERPPYREVARDNYTYVVSNAGGRFYARAIPADKRGEAGITKVHRVRDGGEDEVLDSYDWYATPRTVILCGNPFTNEVAVVRHEPRSGLDIDDVGNEIVLRFFRGGKLLETYRVRDLERLGATIKRLSPEHSFYTQDYVVDGCERIGESQYAFTLRTSGNRRIQFDIRTGRPPEVREAED